MPKEETVTIVVNDDGTIDLEKFADNPHLTKVKQLVDGLRGNVTQLKTTAKDLESFKALGSLEQLMTWKNEAGAATSLKDRIAELEGQTKMTDAEKKELEGLRALKTKLGDVDPDKALEAIKFQAETKRDKAIADAFKLAGFDPEVALGLHGVRDLETRVETVDGKQVAQVKRNNAWEGLEGFTKAQYARFLNVLQPSEQKTDLGSGSNRKGEKVFSETDLAKMTPDEINQHWESISKK